MICGRIRALDKASRPERRTSDLHAAQWYRARSWAVSIMPTGGQPEARMRQVASTAYEMLVFEYLPVDTPSLIVILYG